MRVWNPETGAEDAAARPFTGKDTLAEHCARMLRGEIRDERRDHAVF